MFEMLKDILLHEKLELHKYPIDEFMRNEFDQQYDHLLDIDQSKIQSL
jgi:hypothetical protein